MVLPPPRSISSQPAASSSRRCSSFSLRAPYLLLTLALLSRPAATRLGSHMLDRKILTARLTLGRQERSSGHRIPLDKEFGVVPGPAGARRVEGLLVCDQDQQIDGPASGEVRVQKRAEPLPQVVRVPEGPLGVGAVRLDIRLMMSFAGFAKELLQLLG